VLEPIPSADGHFDSLSAYDFIEHMPRPRRAAEQRSTRCRSSS
jgi:hypothetical protein